MAQLKAEGLSPPKWLGRHPNSGAAPGAAAANNHHLPEPQLCRPGGPSVIYSDISTEVSAHTYLAESPFQQHEHETARDQKENSHFMATGDNTVEAIAVNVIGGP